MQAVTKVILDTDIGSDIDDAICLAYLLAQPRCELLGVTTVSGEPVERARLVSALCQAAGRDVPIYPGAENPFLIPQQQPRVPQAAMLDRWPHATRFPQGEAIDFLRRTIRAHPGEVTLLAIGPMTNVGLLFASDPEIPALLKQLVMMVGRFSNQQPGLWPVEWNAGCDPHAIAKIYQTPVAVHRSIGLDVTTQVTMKSQEVRQRFQIGLLRPVLDFAEVWFEERPVITFHDPLAALTLFDNQVCTFSRGKVEVELTSPRLLGLTHWQPDTTGPHEVALEVNPARFFEQYFSVF
ncbi:MAG: nucleoside hydrolase [Chloroflexi bacterium]|nr:nucleoside hydrolase [Chloroflexota bacterium]